MATYARLQGGSVAELFTTTSDMAKLFPQALAWLDVTSTPLVAVGWTVRGGVASPPAHAPAHAPAPPAPPSVAVSLAAMQAQLTAMQAQLDQFAGSDGAVP